MKLKFLITNLFHVFLSNLITIVTSVIVVLILPKIMDSLSTVVG
ncbi:Wzx [Streptococcus pneumoniae]|nr:Wzx [Streptococcus pneumoniae]